ncbi:DUF2971 domain-containing protein [Burkholderia stagnalis]|uniref:DUF2971 domain-containing protein n=1 Tax=Burkholderia stagnalis TaxID=1503054 RepID=UPI0009C012BF|nr:DUF2971 domain-containing protein [Burkholderia stagnalis]
MICYKFRAFDQRALEILINRELYFAAPHTLNDPLDSQLDIEKEYELAQVPLIYIEDAEERSRQFFLLNLLNSQRFTDKDGGKINFNQAIQRFIASTGILSLSKTVIDALLWSHYAAGHTGIAIGIEVDLLDKSEIHDAGDVIYTDEPPYAAVFHELLEDIGKFVKPWDSAHEPHPDDHDNFYTNQIGKMVKANRYTKSEKWSYEEEYRAIRIKPGFVGFPALALKEIVFGYRTAEKDIRTVMNLLRGEEWKHVRYFLARPMPGTFQLSLLPVPNKTNATTSGEQSIDKAAAAAPNGANPSPDA